MKSDSLRPSFTAARVLAWLTLPLAASALTLGLARPAGATTALADSPVFATSAVPGNLALALSVEWPTAVRTAHTDTTYVATTTYLGYFDPDKCYLYYTGTETGNDLSHFYPVGRFTTRNCSGAGQWSGNYLNWASTPTIDPFRWAMTGGYRIVDTTSTTILQKARHTGQGSLTPDKSVTTSATTQGATPFSGEIHSRIQGLGVRMRFASTNARLGNTVTAYTSALTAMATDRAYDVMMRVKVCDPAATAGGVESNCRQYGSNWKPEGLIQRYANRIRFSAFGYLNDGNMLRDGAVLRAQQKFVGPRQPVPGEPDVENALREWDATTGVFITNPDPTDATQTNSDFSPSVNVTNSGVINYLNKFGQLNTNNYKDFDPVSELYYTALRYFKNQGHVPEYSAMALALPATRSNWLDNFPAITRWNDPIQYSCQRNFILGIGDIYTHRDKNLPGASGALDEPLKPAAVSSDPLSTVDYTNRAFQIQGLANPNTTSYSGRNNSAGIVGLAYYANTVDIRTDDVSQPQTRGRQTVQTYWVDVLEQPFVSNNQFYLAAKYGGFAVPNDYNPLTRTAALPNEWWSTTGQTVGGQPRPDNYFTAGRPDTMVAGLTEAFERIVASLEAFTTSFSTSLPQVSISGNGSYSALYDPNNWSGEVTASELSFNLAGDPTLTPRWSATARLATQLGGTGWNTDRRVVSWDGTTGVAFRATGTSRLSDAQLATLDTTYDVADDRANYLNYLRGDRTHEQASTVTGSTRAYRTRTALLGDIVGSRARPVGPPALPLSDATNPGYSDFKTAWVSRPTVVYVGANDGMLHAFNGALTGTDSGREIFAYVPSALFSGPNNTPGVDGLAALGRSPLNHRYYVNATPTVFDIDLGRTWNGSAVGTTTNWRSVLIGGLGKGGRSYYAIDVTDPATMTTEAAAAGRVMWEFPRADEPSPVPLGLTFGEPMVVKTRQYGWTVIIPSGYNTPDGRGYLFFVNPSNGRLLQTVTTGVGSTTNDAGFAHANAYVLDFTDGYADAVYGGDLLGNLWRFDIRAASGTYPAPLRLATLSHPTDGAQPVTTRPIMELHPRTRTRTVMVGTGRLLADTDISSTGMQTFYAIEDGDAIRFNETANLPAGVDFPIERDELIENTDLLVGYTATTDAPMGWYLDLGKNQTNNVAWRLVTDPTSFFGTVAFAPTLPNADVCSPSGTSRIYGADYATGISRLTTTSGVAPFLPGGDGVVTDLRFLSVGGRVRLIGGTDRGDVRRVPGEFGSTIGLRRLNWRELPLIN